MFDLSKKQWGGRGAVGAEKRLRREERAPRGVGCGEGVSSPSGSPSPLGEGSGEGAVRSCGPTVRPNDFVKKVTKCAYFFAAARL